MHRIDSELLGTLRSSFPTLSINLESEKMSDGKTFTHLVIDGKRSSMYWNSEMAADLLESDDPTRRSVGRDVRGILKEKVIEKIQTLNPKQT